MIIKLNKFYGTEIVQTSGWERVAQVDTKIIREIRPRVGFADHSSYVEEIFYISCRLARSCAAYEITYLHVA